MDSAMLSRGVRKDNGKWITGYYVLHIDRTPCPIGDCEREEDVYHLIFVDGFSDWNMVKPMEMHPVIPKTVGRSTGLSDEYGALIFSGDNIIAYWEGKPLFKGTVVYRDCMFWLEKVQVNDGGWCETNDLDLNGFVKGYDLDIVGNIFDGTDVAGAKDER